VDGHHRVRRDSEHAVATDLRNWIGATLALCLLVGIGVLGGGHDALPQSDDAPHGPSAKWAAEAAGLGNEWRQVWTRWHLESYRARLAPAADSARAAGGTSPLLLIDGPSTPEQRSELNQDLGQTWKEAAPEGFKVAVALVIVRDGAGGPGPDTPTIPAKTAPTYFFPDSLHRDMCLAVVHESYTGRLFFDPHRNHEVRTTDAVRWLSQSLGPCAFYGAYGVPGREIGRWLRSEGLNFAVYPRWWTRSPDPWMGFFYDGDSPKARQPVGWWVFMYSFMPWDGAACYGGRVSQCARNVFDSTAIADSQPSHWDESQWNREQPFFGGVAYLSDLARDLGPARFSDFWSADLPMDSAFHLATGRTVGDWTLKWARTSGPSLHLGPAAPVGDVFWGFLPALLALGAGLGYARRRQIG
jgi:hypothetical protein